MWGRLEGCVDEELSSSAILVHLLVMMPIIITTII